MKHTTITLSVTQGKFKGKEYVFEEAAWCLIGRAEDCTIRLPTDQEHHSISRHHCLLEIAPPELVVRDLGSLNGTYVNGRKIGQRPASVSPEAADHHSTRSLELKDGDEVRVGTMVFLVTVSAATGADSLLDFPLEVMNL
jgi:pSer/pThr/pTyr-binding forkhead associated (FHA) protein